MSDITYIQLHGHCAGIAFTVCVTLQICIWIIESYDVGVERQCMICRKHSIMYINTAATILYKENKLRETIRKVTTGDTVNPINRLSK